MIFQFDLVEGEELVYGEVFDPDDKIKSFALAVTNKAVFFTEKRRFAFRDPWTLHRFSIEKILSVALHRAKPYAWWILSAVMILAGLALSLWMYLPGWGDPEGIRSGYPLGLIAGGLVLPFIIRGRMILELNTVDRNLRWKPPITVNSGPRKQVFAMQHAFVEACRNVGITVRESIA